MNKYLNRIFKSDIFANFTSLNYLPRWFILIVDVAISCFSAYVVIKVSLLFKFNVSELALPVIARVLLIVIFQFFFFTVFRTYLGVLRYSSFVDAIKLVLAVVANILFLYAIHFFSLGIWGFRIFHDSTLILYGILAFVLLFLVRLIVKTTYDFVSMNSQITTPVLIYGTKDAGVALAKMLKTATNNKYKLVGFVDTDKDITSKELMGVKVYDLTEKFVEKELAIKAKAVIVTSAKMDVIDAKTDLDVFINHGLKVLRVPPLETWNEVGLNARQIKAVQIEDLLERPQIKLSTDNISTMLKDKIVLVTGGVGSIGSEIVRQCVSFSPSLIIILDNAESPMHDLLLNLKEKYPKQNFVGFLGDVRNMERMNLMMSTYKPDIVFHAAAYKHVPLIEENPSEGIQTNVLGTKIMADLAVKYGVKRFVMVSTDKAVNPTNVMGASKRIAEIYVQSLNKYQQKNAKTSPTKFITTRFGNVLGSNGSVVPIFRKQIENGGPVTVTHPDIIRYFMTIPEACMLVLEAGVAGDGGEIYIFDMGDPVKIYDLAKKMIRLAGFEPGVDIPIQFTGLRAGEKLYEELLNKKEITKETHHPKIMIASVREYEFEDIDKRIGEMIETSYMCKNFVTVAQMKAIVPEFVSNNSEYERLDIEIDTKL